MKQVNCYLLLSHESLLLVIMMCQFIISLVLFCVCVCVHACTCLCLCNTLLTYYIASIQYENFYHHTPEKAGAPAAHVHVPPPTMKNRPLPVEPPNEKPPVFPPPIGMVLTKLMYCIYPNRSPGVYFL